MTLPASGPLTLADIQTEFGGTNPIGMNEYYAGGGLVPAGTSGTYGTVPSSGALSVQNFYGTSAVIPVYIEEIFSTYLYTMNNTTQTITNGINLSANGGLMWFKIRNEGTQAHSWIDSARGNNALYSNLTVAQDALRVNGGGAGSIALNTNGFTFSGSVFDNYGNMNSGTTDPVVSWTFRKQPKFFDIVTWTGNGVNGRTIPHNLGSTPACIIAKSSSAGSTNWPVYHRSLGGGTGNGYAWLNLTNAASIYGGAYWGTGGTNFVAPTSTNFTVSDDGAINATGQTYVAYLFAHNAGGFGLTGTDNVISCGSFITNGSGNATVNLGYEPQWVLMKPATTSASGNWIIADNMRGWTSDGAGGNANQQLYANNSDAESGGTPANLTSTGFNFTSGGYGPWANQTWIYIAIRRGPMKVPTSGTSVFNPVAQAGNGSTQNITTGFTTDLVIGGSRTANPIQGFVDRLRGNTKALLPNNTSAEDTSPSGRDLTSFASNTGFTLGYPPFATSYNTNGNNIYWNFARAPRFFDEVCYIGTGSTLVLNHNLTVAPELIIGKRRTGGSYWILGGNFGASTYWYKNDWGANDSSTNTSYSGGLSFGAQPTTTTVTLDNNSALNVSAYNAVLWMWATCAGVSKVGTYTGTGTTLQINCGFTSGARFVLITRVGVVGGNATYIWDSARGIVSGNDPYLILNNTDAEVTNTNYIDTYSAGFVISSTAPSAINASGGSFIFLAIA